MNLSSPDISDRDSNARDWLSLIRAPGLGPATLKPFFDSSSSVSELLSQLRQSSDTRVKKALDGIDEAQIESDENWLNSSENKLIHYFSPQYPAFLRELPDAPIALFARGDTELLDFPQLAIVGSRSATQGGLVNAGAFAEFLAKNGIVITSGLAKGIDAAAHKGALAANGGTIAIMGTGLDRIYPAEHKQLAHQIADNGLILTEYPPGTGPHPGNFPRRNRLIAGLSLGTLVVEAAVKSGSLITARLASEMGRDVFAIPGSIHNPMARGCHALIRQGAKLVETAEDIVEELLPKLSTSEKPADASETLEVSAQIDADHAAILDAMGFDPVTTDQIVENSPFNAAEVSSILLLLELQGHVLSESGGRFIRLR